MSNQVLTKDQAKKLGALTNVLVEAEREYLRSKLRFSSYGRRAGWADKVKAARAEWNAYVAQLQEPLL